MKGNVSANAAVVESFMIVSRRCTERNYKKRCTMEEVSNNLVIQCEYCHKGIINAGRTSMGEVHSFVSA